MSSTEISRMDFVAARGVPRPDGQRGDKAPGDERAPSFDDVVATISDTADPKSTAAGGAHRGRCQPPASDGFPHRMLHARGRGSDETIDAAAREGAAAAREADQEASIAEAFGDLSLQTGGKGRERVLDAARKDDKDAGDSGDDDRSGTSDGAEDAASLLVALMLPTGPRQAGAAAWASGDADRDGASGTGNGKAGGPRSRLSSVDTVEAASSAVAKDGEGTSAGPSAGAAPGSADQRRAAGETHRNGAGMMPGLRMAGVAAATPLPAEAGATRLARLSAELQTRLPGTGAGREDGAAGTTDAANLAGVDGGNDRPGPADGKGRAQDRGGGQNAGADGRSSSAAFGRDALANADPKAGPLADAGRATPGPAMLAPTTSGHAQSLASAIADAPDWQAALRPASLADPASRPPGTVNALRIQLNPADLGLVTATLRMTGERLTIELRVETREAYRQLSADHEAIAEKLKGHGYVVDQIRVHQVAGDRSIATQPPAGGQVDQQLQGQMQSGQGQQRELGGGDAGGRRSGSGSSGFGTTDGGSAAGGEVDADALGSRGSRNRGLYL